MTRFFAALGSNLGDREWALRAALETIGRAPGVAVDRVSSIYETEPVGPPNQPDYLNAVFGGETLLDPLRLWRLFRSTEIGLGRRVRRRWCAREIDIDLLMMEDRHMRSAELTLPHPRMCGRRFVLEPLVELAPELRHPLLGLTMAELLRRCPRGHALRRLGALSEVGAPLPC